MLKRLFCLFTIAATACAAEAVDITDIDMMIVCGEAVHYRSVPAEIVFANSDKTHVFFGNFFDSGARISGTLASGGELTIAPQPCGSDASGNYLMLVAAESVNGSPFEISNTRLCGNFDGTTLVFDPWNLMIVPPSFAENLGTYFPENVTSTFVKSNGSMEYAVVGGSRVTVPIYAEIGEDDVLDVYGWGRSGKVTIENRAIKLSATAYWMDGAEYVVVAPDGTDVKCTAVPDAHTVLFEAWQFKDSKTGKVVCDCSSAKLTLDFDLPPALGIDAPVAESEIMGTIFYNAAGARSASPFSGLNFRIEVLTDGTTRPSLWWIK